MNRYGVLACCVLAMCSSVVRGQTAGDKLRFEVVPAETSGLGHVLNCDTQKYGKITWPWMSPLVDIDADGRLDIMIYGHHGGSAMTWLGRGDGTFAFDESGYSKRWTFVGRDPCWMDLNGDGAIDGIGTEHVAGQIFLNDGKGYWRYSGLKIPGNFQFVDASGAGRFDSIWSGGVVSRMDPPLEAWTSEPPKKLTLTPVWNAVEALGWPEGVDKGQFGGWRDIYPADLTGDHTNERIVSVKGAGFYTSQLVTWVLTRAESGSGQDAWKDTTAERGLPTGLGHHLFPEDIDSDGHMDLLDLETGQWHRNDGQGRFTLGATRLYDPAARSKKPKRPWTPDCDLDWVDLDNDGHRDLVFGHAHGGSTAGGGAFLNLGGGNFAEAKLPTTYARGRKFGDVNGDGRLDMAIHSGGITALHLNRTPHNGLSVNLLPKSRAVGRLGVKMWVYEAGRLGDDKALVQYRQEFMGNRSDRSNVLTGSVHVGLGTREAVDIRVRFPSGTVKEVKAAKAGSVVEIAET